MSTRRSRPQQQDMAWPDEPFALVSQLGIDFERVEAERRRREWERAEAETEQERFNVFEGGGLE
jgi:hypothetical protein